MCMLVLQCVQHYRDAHILFHGLSQHAYVSNDRTELDKCEYVTYLANFSEVKAVGVYIANLQRFSLTSSA
jgi:hypothetical protein